MSAWNPRFDITVTATTLDTQVEREHGDDLVSVDGLAALVDGEHPVAVAVEGDAEVETLGGDEPSQGAEVGRTDAVVDVRAVRRHADRVHLCPAALEHGRGDVEECAVRAVDPDPKAGEIRPEGVDDVGDVALARVVGALDGTAAGAGCVEQRLDLLLLLVDELASVEEELHAVVLGRVVRGRHDDAEMLGEERDSRGRKNAAENGGATRGHDPSGDRLLELGSRRARVAADEHAPAARPQRRSACGALDELRRQIGADDAANTIGSEVAPAHSAK